MEETRRLFFASAEQQQHWREPVGESQVLEKHGPKSTIGNPFAGCQPAAGCALFVLHWRDLPPLSGGDNSRLDDLCVRTIRERRRSGRRFFIGEVQKALAEEYMIRYHPHRKAAKKRFGSFQLEVRYEY